MALKKTVNDSLSRFTGYQVTRAQGGGASLSARQVRSLSTSSHALATTAKALAATVRQLEAELKTARAAAAPPAPAPVPPTAKAAPRPDAFPRDYDEDVAAIIRAVRPYSMTGNDQLHALISATKHVSRHDVPGAIVEFGVWRGGNMKAAALALEAADDVSRDLYLYDTFAGVTATDEEAPIDADPAGSGEARVGHAPVVASLADVQDRFATGRYPQQKIHLNQGRVAEAIAHQLPEQIAILRLDTDSTELTDDEFKQVYDRLVSGGVLLVDGYGWSGSGHTAAEFLDRTAERLLLLRVGSGRVAVKP
jgi:O-methyltransferase